VFAEKNVKKPKTWRRSPSVIAACIAGIAVIVAALIGLAQPLIANINKVEYKLPPEDVKQYNVLTNQINNLKEVFYNSEDIITLSKVDGELLVLAQEQSEILHKYNLNSEPLWPPREIPMTAKQLQKEFVYSKYVIPPVAPFNPLLMIILFAIIVVIMTISFIFVRTQKY
jgi:hypothetical protein